MKITISGTLGSGKSTIAKMLSEKLSLNYYSTGRIARKISEEINAGSLLEINKNAESDTSIDKKIDSYQIELGKNENNFILEGRLGFHFVPDSIKIFLKCDEKTAAARVLSALREEKLQKSDPFRLKEGLGETEESIIASFRERRESENKRYLSLYGIRQDDEQNFDIIIDTSKITPEQVCDTIISYIKNHHKSKN